MPLGHTTLVAWQRADDLYIDIHRLSAAFPADERFGLVSQMRRAAYSVPANIVEGMARRSPRDRLRFLNIAEASLAVVGYCLHVAQRLSYITADTHTRFEGALRQVAAPLHGLRRHLRKRRDPAE